MTSWYLSVGLLCDVNVLGSVGLTSPLIVPHLCHQLQVSLWFILLFACRGQTDRQAGVWRNKCNYILFLIYNMKIMKN